ncbi:MAG: LuxR family transcriptional regulator [Nitrospirae bacterium]|nr:MAG: LuxR family transcriptional regulator [Nitrospirota bacterium]
MLSGTRYRETVAQERAVVETTLDTLLHSLEPLLHPSALQELLRQVGVQLGRQASERYKLSHGRGALVSKTDYAACVSGLQGCGGWGCEVVGQAADFLRVIVPACPFGRGAADDANYCEVTSGFFGGVAADQFGYAEVSIERGKGIPPQGCCVTIRTGQPKAGQASGRVYRKHQDDQAGREPHGSQWAGASPACKLSPVECDLLKLVGQGLTDKEIATAMQLSVRTVENYAARIRRKLGLRGRSGMVRFAVEHHLTD